MTKTIVCGGKKYMYTTTQSCKDCLNGIMSKVKLTCGHFVCDRCMSKYISNFFINDTNYDYNGYCPKCLKANKISKFIVYIATILLGCGCTWTDIGIKMPNLVDFNGKYYGKNRLNNIWEMSTRA